MDVTVNGSSIGTISASTGGVFTFTTTGGTAKSMVTRDRLDVVAPASSDATAVDIVVTLAAALA